QKDVHAGCGGRALIQDLREHTAILAFQVDVGSDPALGRSTPRGITAVDLWEAARSEEGGSDVHGPRRNVVVAGAYAGPGEPERRAGLTHVERAMTPRLDPLRPVLGRDHKVRSVRRVEELGHALIRERVTLVLGADKTARGLFPCEARCPGRGDFLLDRAESGVVLPGERVFPQELDHFEREATVAAAASDKTD